MTATAGAAPAAASGAVTIHVHYTTTINGAAPGDWVNAAQKHADDLMRIIDDKLNRRARLRFE